MMKKDSLRTIEQFCNSRDNNLNLLRFFAAFAVVWSHAFIVVGGDLATEPLMNEVGYTLGHLAVNVFFVISGFLIAQSLVRSKDMFEYFSARFLRLIPGLFVASVITVFVIGPLFSNEGPPAYFSYLSTWAYVPLTSSMLVDNGQLPGVFANVPFALELNTPLWTLRWEAMAYVGLAVLGMLGLMSTKLRFAAVLALFVALYLVVTIYTDLRETIAPVDHIMRFGLCFLLGSAAYMFRDKIPVTLVLVIPLVLLPAVLRDTDFYQMAFILAIAYTTFWLAYVPAGFVRQYNKIGDFSYGIYIYGFPIKQIVITLMPELDPLSLMAIVTPLIIMVAAASFYFVERPALHKRHLLAAKMRGIAERFNFKRASTMPAE